MRDQREDEENLDDVEKPTMREHGLADRAQVMGVRVERLFAPQELEVSVHMPKNEEHKEES